MNDVPEGLPDSSMSTTATSRMPCPVIVTPPSKRTAIRALREAGSEPVAWCYLGETLRTELACRQWFEGLAERIEIGALLRETSRRSREPFIEYIGELSERHGSDTWWLGSLAEKNPYVSRVFLHACYVAVAERLLREREGTGALLLLVEDRAVRRCLRDHFAYRLGADVHCCERVGVDLRAWFDETLQFWVRWGLFIARHLGRIAIARGLVGREDRAVDGHGQGAGLTLIHSWVDGRCFDGAGAYQSVNFGNLDRYLAAQGRTVAIVPAILPALPFRAGVLALLRSGVRFLFPQLYLRPGDVICTAVRTIPKPPALAWPPFQGLDISALIEEDRRQDWLKGRPRTNLLHGAAVRRWRDAGIPIASFIYTFENHVWEKAYVLAFRRHYPDVRLIGYQDANLPRMALNFFVAQRERGLVPLPDVLITNGQYSHDLLMASGHVTTRLRCGGAIRYRYLAEPAVEQAGSTDAPWGGSEDARPVVLVTTSIGESLACELLWKAIQAFGRELRVRVVVKCHPGLPFRALSGALGLDRLPPHFEVSVRPLRELLQGSAVLLYMDSTTSLEAVALGVSVVHVASDLDVDFDPLEGASEFRQTVRTPEELRLAVLGGAAVPRRASRGHDPMSYFFGPVDDTFYGWFLDSEIQAGLKSVRVESMPEGMSRRTGTRADLQKPTLR